MGTSPDIGHRYQYVYLSTQLAFAHQYMNLARHLKSVAGAAASQSH